MPVESSSHEGTSQTESSMFAPTPIWEQGARKRRRGGRTAADQPRNDPAMDAGEPGAGAGVMGATTAAEPIDAGYETQPADRELRSGRGGMAAGAIAAGVVVVAGLGALGWYAGQRHDRGMAQLTPGAPATSEFALNSAPPPANPMSANPMPAGAAPETGLESVTPPTDARPVAPHRTTRSETTNSAANRTPRVRPAPAPDTSALSSGVDASTTAPSVNTPPPSPIRRSLQPSPSNPVVNPVNPAAPPSATTPPPGSIDDSAAPTANRSQDPSATP